MNADPPVRVMIVTVIRLYRDGLAELLGRDERIRVEGTAPNPETAVALAQEEPPDVVLIDTAIGDGVGSIRCVHRALPGVSILAFGVAEVEAEVLAFAEAGIAGYVTREASLEQVADGVWGAAHNELECSPRMAASLLRHVRVLAVRRRPPPVSAILTEREREVLTLIDEGLSNKGIADRLCIEIPTVKNRVHHILEKLHVSRRGEAVARVRTSSQAPGI